ncbi:MAG: Oligopeptide transport ATP-binding protein OppD [Myxococcaceae bacterium]|nr:Oligopeptide transport ATP-binding protein OppD [Myxococcaceae bacterium]
MAEPLLEIRDLAVSFRTESGAVRALDGVSIDVPRGRTVGLVGESGSGKSVTSLAIMGLLPRPAARIDKGSIKFQGRELTGLGERALREIRGRHIGMIFQEPMTSLNPVFSVGFQISEALRAHRRISRAEARTRAIALLDRVGIPAAKDRIDSYPHQLSGGMRQRVMIAIALAGEPELLIADEPTTALDVTIQAQILDLLGTLQRDLGMSVLLITHDLGVVAEHAHDVVVMYAGKIVERADTSQLIEAPLHPYTRGLLESVPSYAGNQGRSRLATIAGSVPELSKLPAGCRFADRCARVEADCSLSDPPLLAFAGDRSAACIHVEAGFELDALEAP